jgi:error-prone DNA polymerase
MFLNCHTHYSFLYGTISPAELVQRGKNTGADALVLTDINNTSAWYDFLCECEKEGIKPILGAEFRHESKREFIAIAINNQGIYDLNKFLTEYSETKNYENPQESEHLYLIYSTGKKEPKELKANEYIGIRRTEINRLYNSEYLKYPEKLVALCPVTYKDEQDHQTHKVIQAIDQNTLLTKVDLTHIARSEEYFIPVNVLNRAYENYPFILENTQRLLDSCEITMDLKTPKNKVSFTGTKKGDEAMLEELALKGYYYRYGDNAAAFARIHKELKIISDMNFSAYYLITWDIIRYAGSKGYHHIGRGSGANSIVAYCIRISNVDPIQLDLYFERFINPYRVNPPDFDVDFSWDERDEIIEYIFGKYGREHVCLLATYTTFQKRSIVRELGKIHGLPKNDIDLLVDEPKATDRHHALGPEIYEERDKFVKDTKEKEAEKKKTGYDFEDLPTHLSIHAGGILITEESLYNYTALDLLPKGFPVCQFDMHVAEAWGFYKYDILSQRGLGHIKEAVDIIWDNRKVKIDIHRAADFFTDPVVREQLLSANTIGCFYIESPAMRGLLSKLHCDNFISLVAASSIIRPGVAQSGMMREYITRANNPEKIEYIHPKFKEVLQETFGVMVYQEDVIKIAHHFGGLDMGEADILRRGMSGKSRTKKEFLELQDKYYENCRNFGYSEEMAMEVWRQIESFSGFSFCKAHSASFAVESYQSLFLKTYYPLEFMVAVINNFGGFYGTEQYVHEARVSGAIIEPPCINNSNYKTRIIDKTIYLGFVHVQNLENTFAKKIISEREQNGPYLGLYDFIKRVQVSKEQLNLLIRMGSLRFTGKSKQILLWEKNNYISGKPVHAAMASLLDEEPECDTLPDLEVRPFEDVFDEMDLLGFPLCSPFELIKNKNLGEFILAHEMKNYMHKKVRMVGYYVAKKDVRTSNAKLMNFGTWVDHNGKFFDSVHFPIQLDAYPFTGKGCHLMLGKMIHDFGFPSLEVEKMIRLPMMADPRY